MKGSRATLTLSNTSNVYDSAGRQIATIDAAGLVTTYAYPGPLTSVTISSGVSRRSGGAAEADGLLTNTTVRYPDGQTRYTEQNGIRQTTYRDPNRDRDRNRRDSKEFDPDSDSDFDFDCTDVP